MTAMRRGYVEAAGRVVHYRVCGQGPAVVLLHDSPRSSRLHLGTMAALADSFTVYALDTPGYGNSQPLGLPEPTIADFATALGHALTALGLERPVVYATHTGAKIALALAARGGRMARLVLDGLSIPETLAAPQFVEAYMRPFTIDDSGAYLAAEWSRTRDMLRWFPWFTPTTAARMMAEPPGPAWLADYGIDLFSAGPHYADAYAAAMRWSPMDDLLAVEVPTLVAARSDDVLYGFLDKVPVDRNPALRVARLSADRGAWLDWLRSALAEPGSADPALAAVSGPARTAGATAMGYIDGPHGQVHWQRIGTGAPALALSAPTTLQALGWAQALGGSHDVLVPDLPGFGESDALPAGAADAGAGGKPDADAIADGLGALLDAQATGPVTVLGIGIAAPLAARLAARHPEKVARLVIDGAPPPGDPRFGQGLYPEVAFDPHAGSHLHRIWHLLRDGEVQWPWCDASGAAARRLPPLLGGAGLHRALTGVLKQPATWGQAADAALAVNTTDTWASVPVPTLVFRHADPAFAGAAGLAAAIAGARLIERPDGLDEAARLLAQGEG